MFKNYFKTALRNFKKNKIFSFINIVGLSIGLTCFVLIAVFVYDELSYDQYAADAKDIYRVQLNVTGNGDVAVYPDVDFAVGEGMKNAYPEVREFARMSQASDFVKYNNKQFKETKLAFADSNFLQMFSIPLIEGSNKDALVQPNNVVISKAFAKKYFGDEAAIGKSITIGLHNDVYKVTGVYDKVPDNTHFHFDAFISLSSLHITNPTWSNIGTFTYLKLNTNVDAKKLQAKFPQLVKEHEVPEAMHDMGISYAEAYERCKQFCFHLTAINRYSIFTHIQSMR